MTDERLWADAVDLAADLADADTDEESARAIAAFLDAVVPLDTLIPGVLGSAAEAADGPVFERIVQALIDALRVDPERRAARKERRAQRKADRQARRARRQDARHE